MRPDETSPDWRGSDFERFEKWNEIGPVLMGPAAVHTWRTDPRRLPIMLARYKFVAKMLAGRQRAIEIGCGDGFNMRIVLQAVPSVHGVDVDPIQIAWAAEQARREGLSCTFARADVTQAPLTGDYDAAYSLDVIEHIPPPLEARFIANLAAPLRRDAVCIIGTPNIHSEGHASKYSREGHINLKSAETLRESLMPTFENVFIFSMNDEVVHTGFYPMAHYLIALCAGLRG
jgi:cyclopropane fatty-acyl-phospholipid synthase-like methyltransferase